MKVSGHIEPGEKRNITLLNSSMRPFVVDMLFGFYIEIELLPSGSINQKLSFTSGSWGHERTSICAALILKRSVSTERRGLSNPN
jgi:hypothetical protein